MVSAVRTSTVVLSYDANLVLGFLSNARHLNGEQLCMFIQARLLNDPLTAKALLIVVGDAVVLDVGPLWHAFMNYDTHSLVPRSPVAETAPQPPSRSHAYSLPHWRSHSPTPLAPSVQTHPPDEHNLSYEATLPRAAGHNAPARAGGRRGRPMGMEERQRRRSRGGTWDDSAWDEKPAMRAPPPQPTSASSVLRQAKGLEKRLRSKSVPLSQVAKSYVVSEGRTTCSGSSKTSCAKEVRLYPPGSSNQQRQDCQGVLSCRRRG